MLTVFSFGSYYANSLVVYSLLALLVGAKSTCLVRRDVPRAVSGVLAYAGALCFGPAGGFTIGLSAGFGVGVGGPSTNPTSRIFRSGLQAALGGLAAGLVRSYLIRNAEPGLYADIAVILGPAIPCFSLLLAGEFFAGHQRNWALANQRMHGNRIAVEFGAGVGVVIATQLLLGTTGWQPMVFLVPLVYLFKSSLSELLAENCMHLSGSRSSLSDLYLATIESLVCAIDAKERYKSHHTKGVEHIAVAIAQQMRLSPSDVEGIRTAALLHDIGRLGVPEHILLKSGKLDAQEFSKIQAHSTIGERILDNVSFPWPVGSMIRSHHERWDGTGYPDGLSGEDIPLGARILAVADVCDAMTNARTYRSDNSPEQAIEYIESAAGKHFDPDVVAAFQAAIELYGLPGFANAQERLSTTESGVGVERGLPGSDRPRNTVGGDISRASDEFLAMYEIAQTASTTLNLDEVLSLVAGKVRNMIGCSTCCIFLLDADSLTLRARMAVGVNDRYFEDATADVGRGLTGMVARTGEGLVAAYTPDDLKFRRLYMQLIELQSVMVTPIAHNGKLIGTINLYDMRADAFTKEDLRLLSSVAPQVGQAVQNSMLFEETRESALTDVLTGLHNARYMLLHLEQELSRARRSMRPVSILGLDLDNFKPINDTFGHQQGDEVLRELGRLFISQVRDYDVVCRYAGDEFVIILPDSDRAEAQETAQRIKDAVDAYDPNFHHDQPIRIGVSIGVATFPADGVDVRSLISQADAAMYADKRERKSKRKAA